MNSEPGGTSTNCGVEGGGEVMDALDFPNGLNLIEYLNEEEEAGSSESNDGSSDAEESGGDDEQLQALYATLGSTFPSSDLFENANQQQVGSMHPYAPINPQPSHTAYGLHPIRFPHGISATRGEFLAGPTQFAMPPPFHFQPTPGCFPPGYSQPVYLVPQPMPVIPHHQAGVPQLCTLMPSSFCQHPQAYAQAPVSSQMTPVLLAHPASSHLHFHHQGQNQLSAINEVDIVPASLSCDFSSPPSRSNPSVPSTPSTPSNNNGMGCFQAPFGLPTHHATSHHSTAIPSSTSTMFPIDVGVSQHAATGSQRHQLFTPFLPPTPAPACGVGLPVRSEPSICGNKPQSAVSQSTTPSEQRVETTTSAMDPHAHHRIPVYLQAYRQEQPSIVGVPLAAGSTTENPASTTVTDVALQGGVEQFAGGDALLPSGGNGQEPGAGEGGGGGTIDTPTPSRSSKRKQQFPPPTSPPLTRRPPDAKRVFVLSSENLAASWQLSSDPRTTNKIGGGKITVLRPVSTPTPTTSTEHQQEMIEAGKKERNETRKRDAPGQAQIVQRIATPEGWDRMNEWLKAADQTKNTERLKVLLSKCLEANITIELLEKSKNDADNSLPKFVQQLSKRSKDSMVAKLASQIVAKWKRVIKESGASTSGGTSNNKAPSSADAKIVVPPKHHTQTEANILDQVQEEMDKSYSTAAGGPSSSATATTTNSATTTTTSQTRSTTRASTVKTKMSNRRLTGLEGNDDEIETSSSQQHASRRPGSTPHASASTTTPSYLAALRSAGQPMPAAPPTGTSAKREHYKESSSFMDALNQQAATETAAKKSKIMRKKLGGTQTNKTTAAAAITPTSSSGSFDTPTPVEGALHVDTSGKGMAGEVAEQPTTSGGSGTAKNKRKKVSFVEGAKMVQVRYFNVEEGERVNVTKMSFELKKQMDMKKESMDLSTTFSHSHSRIVTAMPMPPGFSPRHLPTTSSSRPWKLTRLDDVIEQIERGVNSQSKLIELERQKTALEAFYDWKIVCPISDLDEEDCPSHDLPEPPIIPLELKPEREEDSATTPATAGRQAHTSTASIITQLPLPPSATTTSGAVSTSSMAPTVYKKSPEQVVDAVSPASPESSPSRQGAGGGKSAVRRLIPSRSSSSSSPPSVVDISSPEGPQSPEDTDIRHRVEDEAAPPANVPITTTTTTIRETDTGTDRNSRGGMNDPLELVNRLKQAGMMDSGLLRGVLNKIQQHNNESPSISSSSASAAIDSAASVSTPNKLETLVGQGAVTVLPQKPLPSASAAIATPTTIPQSGLFLNQFPSMSVPPPNIAGGGVRPSAFVPATFTHPPPGYPLAVIPPQSNVFSSPPPTMHSGVQRSPAVVGRASAFSTPPNNNLTASGGGSGSGSVASSSLPPPGLILSLPHIASNHHDSNNSQQQQPRSIAAANSSLPASQPCLSNTTATLHPPGLEGNAVDSGPNRGGFSFPPSQQQSISSSSPSDPREQMSANRTFVKQCTFYQGGGCRFGEQCLYAHGEEMTIGVKQALAAVGNTSPPRSRGAFVGRGGRGGRFGGWGGGGRGGGGGGSGSQHHLTAVGGGIEISYDEREGRVRAWQIPPTHVMVTGDRNVDDDRGPSRFSITFSSRSISPIRVGRRRSRSKSKSRSVSRSRSPRPPRSVDRGRGDSNDDERHRNSRGSRRRRGSRSPPARRDRRDAEWKNKSPETAGTGRDSKRRSNDNSASPTPPPRDGKRRAVRRSRSPEPDRAVGADGVADASAGGRASSSRWENEQQRRMPAGASEGCDNGGSHSSRSRSNPQLGEEIVIDCDDDDNNGPRSGGGGRTNSPPSPSPPTRTGSRRRRRSPSASSSSSSSSGASSTDE